MALVGLACGTFAMANSDPRMGGIARCSMTSTWQAAVEPDSQVSNIIGELGRRRELGGLRRKLKPRSQQYGAAFGLELIRDD